MPSTYDRIATQTVSTPVNTITFSSIPSTYTHLRVVMTLADDDGEAGTGAPTFRFNNDSGTNYSQIVLRGDGSSASSQMQISKTWIYALYWNNSPTSTVLFPMMTLDIFNYAGSTNKTTLITAADDRNGTGSVERSVGLWRSTAAINRLDILNDGGRNFETGSRVSLYGIVKA